MKSYTIFLILAMIIQISYSIHHPFPLKPVSTLTFSIFHEAHPKVQTHFNNHHTNAIANFTGNSNNYHYYVEVFFGTPPAPLLFVFDTGSFFTWMQYDRAIQSSTYDRVAITNTLCKDAPGNNYNQTGGQQNDCEFEFTYGDGSSTKGVVGHDGFDLFEADGVHPVDIVMIFGGVTDGSVKHDGVMGISDHPAGLMTALETKHMSICFPQNISQQSVVRFGMDSVISGRSTELIKSNFKWVFNVTAIRAARSISSIGGSVCGDGFIFDTGSSVSYLKSDLMDEFMALVLSLVRAERILYNNYDLCFENSVLKENIIISFVVGDGADGTLDFQSDSLWDIVNIDACMTIKRAPASVNKSMLGARQMAGWAFGVDTTISKFYYKRADC